MPGVAFDLVQVVDPVEHGAGDWVTLLDGNDEFAPRMHPAAEPDDNRLGSDGVVGSVAVRHPVAEDPAEGGAGGQLGCAIVISLGQSED